MRCRSLHLGRKYPVNLGFFDGWSDDLAYVLGLMFTDGHIRSNGAVGFKSLDFPLAGFVRDNLAPDSPVGIEHTKAGTPVARWSFWSEALVARLRDFGITPRKSLTIIWPEIPVDYCWPFLRGLIDGDGHIDRVRRISIATGSRRFADGMQAYFAALGYQSSIYRNARVFSVSFGIPVSRRLAPLIYPPGAFCLDRKRLRLIPG